MNTVTEGLWTFLSMTRVLLQQPYWTWLYVYSVNRMGKFHVVELWIKTWFQIVYHPGHFMDLFLTSPRWAESSCTSTVICSTNTSYGMVEVQGGSSELSCYLTYISSWMLTSVRSAHFHVINYISKKDTAYVLVYVHVPYGAEKCK
jgi:hypothetical protein